MQQDKRKELIQSSFRLAQRTATCRICGTFISRDEEMLSYSPHGSQDRQAHICVSCIETIAEIVQEKKDFNS